MNIYDYWMVNLAAYMEINAPPSFISSWAQNLFMSLSDWKKMQAVLKLDLKYLFFYVTKFGKLSSYVGEHVKNTG